MVSGRMTANRMPNMFLLAMCSCYPIVGARRNLVVSGKLADQVNEHLQPIQNQLNSGVLRFDVRQIQSRRVASLTFHQTCVILPIHPEYLVSRESGASPREDGLRRSDRRGCAETKPRFTVKEPAAHLRGETFGRVASAGKSSLNLTGK